MDLAKTSDLNEALAGLLGKYEVEVTEPWRLRDGARPADKVPADELTLGPGWLYAEADLPDGIVPLRPWRSERRFVELRRLAEDETIVPVLMCRFSCLTDGEAVGLDAVLYRELDLVEWLVGSRVASVHAAIDADRAANLVVRLANDVICSVEAGTTLPPGTPMQDRHEMIARRGVASDRVVDTQVEQSSVYLWSDSERGRFTDT
ncbi:MAG: hypothetical protein GY842_20925, partial [bacterium]|nr:hypothetical protein [bacterium]